MLLNQPREAEPFLEEAHQLDPIWGHSLAHVLIANGNYRRAEEVARAAVTWLDGDGAARSVWKEELEIEASLGGIRAQSSLVKALCLLGRFDDAEAFLTQQLENRKNAPSSAEQCKTLKQLQLGVQAYAGRWREAMAGLIAVATEPAARMGALELGMAAARAIDNQEAYEQFVRRARSRYLADADANTAGTLFEALILHPTGEDVSSTLPNLLSRIEKGPSPGINTAEPNLLFMQGQLAYRQGDYGEALRSVDAWFKSKSDRRVQALLLHHHQSLSAPRFWRAMILARLGRAEEAAQAYNDGVRQMPAVLKDPNLTRAICFGKAMQREARDVLRSQGISVPDAESEP